MVEIGELEKRPYTHGRLYTKEEMWDNFKYFLDRTLPVCEEANVKIALHPNDPPVDCLVGISNLITSAEDYKHAFELAGNSPYLGMKMCIGCWLEGGDKFGNVMAVSYTHLDVYKRQILNLALHSLLVSFLNGILALYSQSYVVILGIYYKLQTFLYLPANGIVQGMRPIDVYKRQGQSDPHRATFNNRFRRDPGRRTGDHCNYH